MATEQDTPHDPFAEVKAAFQGLDLDQKAVFLVSQAASTAVEAAFTLIDAVAEGVDDLFNPPEPAGEEEKNSSPDETA